LAAGVLVGGFGQFMLVWIVLYRDGVFLFPQKISWSPKLSKTLIWWFPTTIGAGIFQFNLLLSRSVSFNLFEGAVAALDYSTMLTELALGIFTTSITSAMLPLLVKPKSAGVNPKEQVVIQESFINISFIIIPGTVGLLLAGFPLVGILFRHGQFGEWSQVITYGALLPGAMMLIPLSWYRILTQLFYAQGKVWALLIIAVIATFFNVIGLYTLPALFSENISHLGINLSLLIFSWCLYVSVSTYAGICLGFRWEKSTVLELGKNLLASMSIIPVWWPLQLQNEGIFTWFLKVAMSIIVYFAVSGILKASGLRQLKRF
jgi:peptidoglycan biosynthesis protein MviN/MurJ (putative lipid II flippase)